MSLLVKNSIKDFISFNDLHPRAVEHLSSSEKPCAIACSGGADSICLLYVMREYFPGKKMVVLHYNHKTRGEDNILEQAHVEKVGGALGLDVYIGSPDEKLEDSSEAALRMLRLGYFHEKMSELGIEDVVLGQHQGDLAESMLMRLSRGSGAGGLATPRPLHRFGNGARHIRPLLNVSKEKILSALEGIGATWCEDSSNEETHYFRNRVRKYLIPEWAAASPTNFYKGLALSREQLEEDDDALNTWVYEIIPHPQYGKDLDLSPLVKKPQALLRRAIRDWLHIQKLSFSNAFFSLLYNKNALNEHLTLPIASYVVTLKAHVLSISQPPVAETFQPFNLPLDTPVAMAGGKFLCAQIIRATPELLDTVIAGNVSNSTAAYLEISDYIETLNVRPWQEGDKFQPLNAPGHQKLQDLFTNNKVPQILRKALPVVTHNDQILWVPGLPINHDFKASKSTKTLLKLTYN